ncbi:hypothetical protein LINPERHAP1_LOCUS4124 [Linum perenne]
MGFEKFIMLIGRQFVSLSVTGGSV